MAQEGIEIVPGNRNMRSMIPSANNAYGQTTPASRPMVSPQEVKLFQELYQRSLEEQMKANNLNAIYGDMKSNTADKKFGVFTSSQRPKKQFGGTTGRRTYSGPKKRKK